MFASYVKSDVLITVFIFINIINWFASYVKSDVLITKGEEINGYDVFASYVKSDVLITYRLGIYARLRVC